MALAGQNHVYTQKAFIPPAYAYNSDSAYKVMVKTPIPGLKAADLKEYAEGLAYYHESMLGSGAIYFEWYEAENYLNSLVEKITTTLEINRTFKVYLIRDEDVNASAQDNGIIYINVGLLAEVKDESALVSVLAHEIAHVIFGDSKNTLLARSRQKSKAGLRNAIALCHSNRRFEARADSLGFEAATDLNYDISSSYQIYTKFETDNRWYMSQYSYQDPKWFVALDNLGKDKDIKPDSLAKYLLDHPENSQRLSQLYQFKTAKNGTLKFSGNEAFFKSLQQKARLEQLYIPFIEADYKSCLRDAFYYHLEDQMNADYLYYIAECLRRMILIDPTLKKKGFLTEDSKEKTFEPNLGILHDLSFISLDTVFKAKVSRDSIYGPKQKPFETYNQAFTFYYKKLGQVKEPARYLTAGLYELARGKNEKGFEYLHKYQEEPGAGLKEFLNAVYSGEQINTLLNNQVDLVIVESVDTYIRDGNRMRYSFVQSQENTGNLIKPFKQYFKVNPGYDLQILFTSEIKELNQYEDFDNLQSTLKNFKPQKEVEFENSARTSALDENYWKSREMNDPFDPEVLVKNKSLFYLEPAYWNFFKEKNLHSFTIVKPYYYQHPLLGMYMYFEIAYFDPVNKRYLYFEPEFMERQNSLEMNKMFKDFRAKLSAIYKH